MNKIPTMAELASQNKQPEVLFWVGCAGSFDQRYKQVTVQFARILQQAGVDFAVLGQEESCTGDPARRAGNEFLFQMQAMNNIEILNAYQVKKIVTACPHCFNILKNEYPELGGNYEVIHHSQFLQQLIASGKIRIKPGDQNPVTYHDSCYLGRANQVYEAPRQVIEALNLDIIEMERSRKNGLCCGAGGAQIFKDSEPGAKEVNLERTDEAISTGANTIATACPFCMLMLSDGLKQRNREENIKLVDLAELVAAQMDTSKTDL